MYKHGAFAEIMATKDYIPPKALGTLPVYFGTLPVHQFREYSDKVNTPILVSSFSAAQVQAGYNDEWSSFTLCEAIDAHFRNNIKPIGPIVLINVLDPSKHATENKTVTVSLLNKTGYIENNKVILNSISIADKQLGVDYDVKYTSDGNRLEIKDIKGTILTPVEVSFKEVDLALVTESELIGGTDAETGIKTGISVVDYVYLTHNMVPTLFCAPGWSEKETVDTALKAASQKINNHWYAFVNSDIESTSVKTIKHAKQAKVEKSYVSSNESPCWPMAYKGTKKYHLSTLATVTMQWVDYENGGVPYETPSNKPVDVVGMCLADGKPIIFDQVQANDLNSKGIRTLSYWGGRWVLWGGHTGEYEYGKDIDKKNVFDCSVRMLQYIANTFQSRYGIQVDKPMNRALKDTILNDMQEWLDNLIAQGKILLGEIVFEETSNPTSDVVEGDFVFDIATTTTPPGKSLTAKICYTVEGINVLFGGDE
ncbi:phage tail sheath protein [Niameybacter massiliensis]|uniref:Phage tail sheath protein n=1 Tax=Holtiella tumoricola TaxID=3018743 RepID=A0AA42DPG7_9FIRM|nr:phage tail sheath protein [Holtiella tumoricola]MDA3732386.1 phage tail sheath protein [Holtiella tumoricola]